MDGWMGLMLSSFNVWMWGRRTVVRLEGRLGCGGGAVGNRDIFLLVIERKRDLYGTIIVKILF